MQGAEDFHFDSCIIYILKNLFKFGISWKFLTLLNLLKVGMEKLKFVTVTELWNLCLVEIFKIENIEMRITELMRFINHSLPFPVFSFLLIITSIPLRKIYLPSENRFILKGEISFSMKQH